MHLNPFLLNLYSQYIRKTAF